MKEEAGVENIGRREVSKAWYYILSHMWYHDEEVSIIQLGLLGATSLEVSKERLFREEKIYSVTNLWRSLCPTIYNSSFLIWAWMVALQYPLADFKELWVGWLWWDKWMWSTVALKWSTTWNSTLGKEERFRYSSFFDYFPPSSIYNHSSPLSLELLFYALSFGLFIIWQV